MVEIEDLTEYGFQGNSLILLKTVSPIKGAIKVIRVILGCEKFKKQRLNKIIRVAYFRFLTDEKYKYHIYVFNS